MIVDAANSIDMFATRGITGASAREPSRSSADFADVLGQAISSAVGAIQAAETASIKGIKGVESVARVVETVMEAQRGLQAMVSIRDKAVGAWQEISRMAI